MAHDDPRYKGVALALPEVMPPITRYEAERASRLLVKRFGKRRDGSPAMLYDVRPPKVRRCWISHVPTRDHFKGWGRLIHDVSHDIFERRHPNARPHDGGHATLERELAQAVVEFGWLEGTLKETKSPPLTVEQKRQTRMLRILAGIERWERKLKRAENALRKLRRRKAALKPLLNADFGRLGPTSN